MDLFQKRTLNVSPLGQYADAEGYFIFPKLEGPIGNRMNFRGKEVITWSVNNYLGLANHPEVIKADAEAAAQYGMAYPMGSRFMSGNTQAHEQLEQNLAAFVGTPSALLVNFGYQGIASAVDALTDRHDIIVYDRHCHACIMDGIRMHKGPHFAYRHNDIEDFKTQLKRAQNKLNTSKGGILVITEGVFGMQGQQGKIKEIVALKDQFEFRLLVDDAHGFGTLGHRGAGVGEEQGVQDDIDIYFSTFAKSMAGIGAFFAGSEEIIQYLKYNIRSQIFAKSLPMPMVMGALKRLELLQSHPEYKEQLWAIATKLQKGLREKGFDLGATNSVITPVFMKGGVPEATELTRDLREEFGIFCSIVVYPVVPKGVVLLRIIPTAVHTEEDVEMTIHAFEMVKERLQLGVYN